MLLGAQPLIGMGYQIPVIGQLRFELVQATEQTLRVGRMVGGSLVAASDQLSWQIELGAIDGKESMSEPCLVGGVGCIGVENSLVDAF